jgi:hypothetical protein
LYRLILLIVRVNRLIASLPFRLRGYVLNRLPSVVTDRLSKMVANSLSRNVLVLLLHGPSGPNTSGPSVIRIEALKRRRDTTTKADYQRGIGEVGLSERVADMRSSDVFQEVTVGLAPVASRAHSGTGASARSCPRCHFCKDSQLSTVIKENTNKHNEADREGKSKGATWSPSARYIYISCAPVAHLALRANQVLARFHFPSALYAALFRLPLLSSI